MSATNHTTTIELSQYISTDKPTYLTDYNGDMLKIDNAIAADRDSISTAQNKANTAVGKADANKLSIDTLNAQINGDPSDPSDTGLAGKVTDNSGDIDTIEALIGNGTPTTSNQTIIGAINGLEGAIAPREDGTDLANSYLIGEQFARGGSVFTALTPLTAGTAFASLTLNTDYKNSDTLVEQIADVKGDVADVSDKLGNLQLLEVHTVTVNADGVKTRAELGAELLTAINSYLSTIEAGPTKPWRISTLLVPSGHVTKDSRILGAASVPSVTAIDFGVSATGATYDIVGISASTHYDYNITTALDGTVTLTDKSSAVPANTVTFRAAIEVYKILS